MRISPQEVQSIKKIILRYISDAKVSLFGSRVYDHKEGVLL